MAQPSVETARYHVQKSVYFDRQYAPLRALKDTNRAAFDGFLFHDIQNTFTGPTGYMEMAQWKIDSTHLGRVATDADMTPELAKIKSVNSKLSSKVSDIENRRVRMDEYSTLIKELIPLADSPEMIELIHQNGSETLKREIEYLPTSAHLVDCYVQVMKYFEHPNPIQLDQLEKMKGPTVKEIFKKFHNIEVKGEDFKPMGIETIMLYTAAHKFSAQFAGEHVTVTRDKAGRIIFQAENMGNHIPKRFARYAESSQQRKPVTENMLKDLEFSQGLLATELLGYITQKDILFTTHDNQAQFTIQPYKPRFEKKITHEVGEPAGIRRLDETDLVDLEHVMQIENPKIERVNRKLNMEELRKTFDTYTKLNHSDESELFVVTAEIDEVTGLPFPSQNRGEVEGLIQADFSKQAKDVFENVSGVAVSTQDTNPIQLSYKLRKRGPSHLMASGIRQFCMNMLRADNLAGADTPGSDTSSRRVIYSQIAPTDKEAISIMNESGFMPQGETGFYVLNWGRLHDISEQMNETRVMQKLTSMMNLPQLNKDTHL